MLDNNGSSKGGMFGVLLLILTIVFYVFYIQPLGEENSLIKAELEEKNAELSVFELESDEIDSAKEALDLTTTVDQITSIAAVPADLSQDEIIRTVIEIAQSFDIELNSISFARSSSEINGVATLGINSSFEGSYIDLIDFLEGLEDHDRLFKVNSINVQIARVGLSDLERANFSLTIDTFYQE